ncbi:uncharacterized protein N7529_008792 [Penicillium soppii]|jgi:hypothetical protein|uniref:uncharacterized protein n=1 Tax=Penicillium soppii TaxID=69789 RepID=UPI002549236D|nr:uncharacterized protein N7529_008792 [Penicillium soppii]KAJ5861482.1 hypothetical protein N7529_008792 [Penicillium soppii]
MSQEQCADGSALTWIFDHCLRYADNYEISLRAAYELNCHPAKSAAAMGNSTFATSRSSSLFSRNSSYSKNRSSGSSYDTASYDANAEFRAYLTRTVSELPSQPCSLPPSFIVSFVRRCFCLELSLVDFNQALTALDYLKDLQNRWKKEIDAAFRRLNVNPEDARDPQQSELARKYPGVMEWYREINKKAYTIDALYTQVYVGLRRWVLVNEMMLDPFDKANCLALLNTLLPPVRYDSLTPTKQLTPKILEKHRDAFFGFITGFEANPEILEPVMAQGARPGEENAWPALYDAMSRYLDAVVEVIEDCALINEPSQVDKSGHQRRTDSGISFGPRPASSHSVDAEKPLPNFPELSDGPSKHGSFLERFAHSMSWGKKKDPVKEQQKEQKKEFSRSLKKMQSFKDIRSRPGSTKTSIEFNKMPFDLTEEKRRRLIEEAKARKAIEAAEAEAQTIGQAI